MLIKSYSKKNIIYLGKRACSYSYKRLLELARLASFSRNINRRGRYSTVST